LSFGLLANTQHLFFSGCIHSIRVSFIGQHWRGK